MGCRSQIACLRMRNSQARHGHHFGNRFCPRGPATALQVAPALEGLRLPAEAAALLPAAEVSHDWWDLATPGTITRCCLS